MRATKLQDILADHSFAYVMRVRLDDWRGRGRIRIRLEDISQSKVWHFSEPASALARLQSCIESRIAAHKH